MCGLQNEKFLKRYLKYARLNCSPRLSEAASDVLIKEYVELRAQVCAHLHRPRCGVRQLC